MKAHVKRYAYKRKVGTPQILYYFIGHKLELCTQKKERHGATERKTRETSAIDAVKNVTNFATTTKEKPTKRKKNTSNICVWQQIRNTNLTNKQTEKKYTKNH